MAALKAEADRLANLMPVRVAVASLSVAEIDRYLAEVDKRIAFITNQMRTHRKTLMRRPSNPSDAVVLHISTVFNLTGLKAVLDSNVTFRNQLVYARSSAVEVAKVS